MRICLLLLRPNKDFAAPYAAIFAWKKLPVELSPMGSEQAQQARYAIVRIHPKSRDLWNPVFARFLVRSIVSRIVDVQFPLR